MSSSSNEAQVFNNCTPGLLEKMKAESSRPESLVPKTIRLPPDFLRWCEDMEREHGIKESVLIRNVVNLGWEHLKRGS